MYLVKQVDLVTRSGWIHPACRWFSLLNYLPWWPGQVILFDSLIILLMVGNCMAIDWLDWFNIRLNSRIKGKLEENLQLLGNLTAIYVFFKCYIYLNKTIFYPRSEKDSPSLRFGLRRRPSSELHLWSDFFLSDSNLYDLVRNFVHNWREKCYLKNRKKRPHD